MSTSELAGVHLTALAAAAARARHLVVEGEPTILVDQYAQRFLGWSNQQVIEHTAQLAERPYGAALWAMRNRFTEDRLAQAITRGVNQYVILGAGLDSFALRNSDTLQIVSVFEVDDPPLQRWKRERLQELGIAEPDWLHFAPCDFESRSIPAALTAAGFDANAPAVVSWLGVTQYLTRAAIADTLGWAASLAAGSEIVLTYIVPGAEAEAEKARFAQRGTRFATFFTPDEIASVLLAAGLVGIETLTPEAAQRIYFDNRSDGLVAPQMERLVVAKAP